MPLIKSHSNYVLKSKHQTINDGTIWERDITTIGGLNQFAPGQTPIYKSSNFIITVRDDNRLTNQYATKKWEKTQSGDVWTLETLSSMTSDYDEENDTKIVLKRDYYDFRDFAYYGSLTELFRSSLTDIMDRFPGEMFFSGEEAYYKYSHVVDGELIGETFQVGKKLVAEEVDGKCVLKEEDYEDESFKGYYYELKNPFGINIYSTKRPVGANPLRYFAEGGYLNFKLVNICEDQECNFTWPGTLVKRICVPKCDNDTCDCEAIESITPPAPSVVCNCEAVDSISDPEPEDSRRSLRTAAKAGGESNSESTGEETTDNCPATPTVVDVKVFIDPSGKIHYMYKDTSLNGYHLRPDSKFIIEFYNDSNAFEKLILNYEAAPRYSSTFSVIRENEFGYFRRFEDFTFPTSEGGYNPTVDDDFIKDLIEIGEFYDERFTDNLWRSMTHEAIKNFDWTFTREYEDGEEIEFVAGGKKIQKALRIFAREFDEIKSFIDNIRFMNRITYDERSNMPDYFLSDACEQDGWDIKYIIPYELEEKYIDNEGNIVVNEDYTNTENQLKNIVSDNVYFTREYSQKLKNTVKLYTVKPYTEKNIKDGSAHGYFYDCSTKVGKCDFTCWLNEAYSSDTGCNLRVASALTHEQKDYPDDPPTYSCTTKYESIAVLTRKDGTDRLTDRIKSYTDETEYSYMGVNNEFLRRLSLNSKYIWRHKGTIDGIEMILGMFGLKSKRWLDRMNCNDMIYTDKGYACQPSLRYKVAEDPCDPQDCEVVPDYEIREYTSFAKRIEEEWDVEHQMYRIDWVNTTKTLVYDYRSQSNYTLPGSIGYTGIPYQGIPVSYREEYSGYTDDKKYLTYGADSSKEYYVDAYGNKISKRYLYPNFNKYEQLDGNPYFQMGGGWLAKKITGISTATEGEEPTEKETAYNFQFDVDDNIVYNKYVPSGYVTTNGFINDNHALYKETIRTIRRVDRLSELVTVPQIELHDGSIYYVDKVGNDVAIINGEVYDVNHQGNLRYVTYRKIDGFIGVGDKFFDETIVVYDKEGRITTYSLYDKENGYEIRAYFKDTIENGVVTNTDFKTYNGDNPAYTIDSFQIISDAVEDNELLTNYYIIDDVSFSDTIASSNLKYGWRRLKRTDHEYMRINTLTNYYNGNNGHNGNMVYDSGHEYFTYFNRIFKYAYDTDNFDTRCYTDGFDWLGGEVFSYGFSGLIDSNEEIKQYDKFILDDEKIHYFGNFKDNPDPNGAQLKKPVRERDYSIKTLYTYGDKHKYAVSTGAEGETDAQIIESANTAISRSLGLAKKDNTGKWETVSGITVSGYTITDMPTYSGSVLAEKGIIDSPTNLDGIDDVTNQILNNKRIKIIFNMKYDFNSKEGQCELKYIDDIVMNYLTQLVPSTAIFDVEYNYCNFNYNKC